MTDPAAAASPLVEKDPVYLAFLLAVKKEGFFDGIKRGTAEWDRVNAKVVTAFRMKMQGLGEEDKAKLTAASIAAAAANRKALPGAVFVHAFQRDYV
jgi:hypothetical protein